MKLYIVHTKFTYLGLGKSNTIMVVDGVGGFRRWFKIDEDTLL